MTQFLDEHESAGWRIRRFERRDGVACREVYLACVEAFTWLSKVPTPPVRFEFEDQRRTWIAEVPGHGVVGFLTLDDRRNYVDYLLVDPDWRLCGVGSGLLRVVREAAAVPLTLSVDAENGRARAAYAAMGWTEIRSQQENGRNTILMQSA